MKQQVSQKICQQLRSVGVQPSDTYILIQQVNKWVQSSGLEWTISRLKSMKEMYISALAHDPKRALLNASWIDYKLKEWKGTRYPIPKGCFSRLFFLPNSSHGKDRKRVQRSLSALMCYTVFKSKTITEKQHKKFYDAVNSTPVYKHDPKIFDHLESTGFQPVRFSDGRFLRCRRL